MAVTLLNSTYQGDNFKPNSKILDLTFSTNGAIDNSNINDLLPNNGQNYKTMNYVGFIPTGSSATIYTDVSMIVASFIAESGITNTTTGYQEGVWKILASVKYK